MLKQLYRRFSGRPSVDSVDYWRKRASAGGTKSVMWANLSYNEMADRDQWRIIERNLPQRRQEVLDMGCGTGRLSARLAHCFTTYTGVDLDTMVAEARRKNPALSDSFISSSLEEYKFPVCCFDLVLSMACLGNACRAERLPEIAQRMADACRPEGKVVLIEPFHRSRLLARACRIQALEVIDLFKAQGMRLDEWTGILFFPARMVLTEMSVFNRLPRITRLGYRIGEAMRCLAPRILSDYSVIVLTKPA